jgi:hypothetical protein
VSKPTLASGHLPLKSSKDNSHQAFKNWANTGPPEYLADPDKALADALEQKKATDKQIAYIAGLLDRLGLTLEETCHKSDYDDLTRLDARSLIDALTSSLEPHDGESETA